MQYGVGSQINSSTGTEFLVRFHIFDDLTKTLQSRFGEYAKSAARLKRPGQRPSVLQPVSGT